MDGKIYFLLRNVLHGKPATTANPPPHPLNSISMNHLDNPNAFIFNLNPIWTSIGPMARLSAYTAFILPSLGLITGR